jgi:enamine deaminase RidA (YjgF/YER057c/UK114 family)
MTSVVEFYSPDTMPPTRGYSQMAHVKSGELLYFSGQVALNAKGELVGADYATQLEQIFRNIELGLKAAGASLENLIKLNFFVSSAVPMPDILASHFAIRDKYNLEKPPASAFVFVSRLFRAEWLLEVESIAVKP